MKFGLKSQENPYILFILLKKQYQQNESVIY